MEIFDHKDYTGGWFIGHFHPALIQTSDFEVSVKYYKAGDKEKRHYHLQAEEYTVIGKGRVRMNGQEIQEGSIVKIDKGESTDFEVLEDTVTFVVKLPSVPNDKFIVDEE